MPAFHEKIALRPMLPGDIEEVLRIESSSFARPWTRSHFLDEIDSPFGHPVVAVTPHGEVAGYLCLKQIFEEGEILDVAVKESLRGQGIGRILMESALKASREMGGEVVSLEVRVGNSEAIALYQRLGFREAGRRKGYYENGDDAIVMEYHFHP